MRKMIKTLFVVALIVSGSLYFNDGYSDTDGASAGLAGGPSDGKCTNCHSSLMKNETGWITSDIDTAVGYEPGKTYTITATMINNESSVSGFQISPQGTGAKAMGTVALITTAKTKIVTGSANRKYVTHTLSGHSDTTWSFNWTAPVVGSGVVTFYGMFNESNANNSTSGDAIHSSKLVVKEKILTGLAENFSGIDNGIVVYPIPASGRLNIALTKNITDKTFVTIYSIDGHVVRSFETNTGPDKTICLDITGIAAGAYIINVKSANTSLQHKIFVE